MNIIKHTILLCSCFFLVNGLNANEFDSLFIEFGGKYNIPPIMLKAIAKTESNFNPKAINKNNNGTQDIGIMQINSIHKDELKSLNIGFNDLLIPKVNIEFGAKILSRCFAKYGFNYKGLNCYNGKLLNNDYSNKVLANIFNKNINVSNLIIK